MLHRLETIVMGEESVTQQMVICDSTVSPAEIPTKQYKHFIKGSAFRVHLLYSRVYPRHCSRQDAYVLYSHTIKLFIIMPAAVYSHFY